ncbi:MAG: phosphatidate cytidylyltransferase [Alphaproteobacteria bacterium]|nr:phosphatidate cytidylyltransferase [Alphaproteobacteria bacterium]
MSELAKRVFSSVFLLLVSGILIGVFALLPSGLHPGLMVLILLILVARLGFEWSFLVPAMDRPLDHPSQRYLIPLGTIGVFSGLFALFVFDELESLFLVFCGLLFISVGYVLKSFIRCHRMLPQFTDDQGMIMPLHCRQWDVALLGAIYIGLAGIGFFAFWSLPEGFSIVCWIVFCVIIADSAAFFGGKRWGRRKICLSISPGKTWVGMFSALIAVFSVLALADLLMPSFALPMDFPHGIMILVIVVLSVWGDLFVSLLKRRSDLKDVTQLIPGHGGLLDRLDGHVMVFGFLSPIALWLTIYQ